MCNLTRKWYTSTSEDGSFVWSEREIRTRNLESGVRGSWRLLRLSHCAPSRCATLLTCASGHYCPFNAFTRSLGELLFVGNHEGKTRQRSTPSDRRKKQSATGFITVCLAIFRLSIRRPLIEADYYGYHSWCTTFWSEWEVFQSSKEWQTIRNQLHINVYLFWIRERLSLVIMQWISFDLCQHLAVVGLFQPACVCACYFERAWVG